MAPNHSRFQFANTNQASTSDLNVGAKPAGAVGQQSGTDSHRYRDDGGDKAGHADAPAPRRERRGGKARGEDREPQDAGRLDERHGDKAQRGERHVVRFAAVDCAQ